MTRVAILFDNFGPYHFARLRAAVAQVELLAIQVRGRSQEYAWETSVEAEAFQHVTLHTQVGANPGSVELQSLVSRPLCAFTPSAVVVPGWASQAALSSLQWSVKNRVPVVVMSESTAWDEPRAAWKEWIKRQVVSCFSSALAGGRPHVDYLAQLEMPRDQIFLGYDAVDNRYFRENAEKLKSETLKEEARQKYGLPEHYFLASARFVEKKNLPRLLQACARYRELAQKSKLWDLVLLGDGELRSSLLALRSSLGLDAHVHLPGFKQYPDLPAYYGCASAFIHASTTEQWGLVVNEAMASGLPVLVSDRCGCAPDLVQNGVNGFTFNPHNVEELARLMLKISTMECGDSSPLSPGGTCPSASTSGFGSASPSTTLAQMGAASQRIIADWGPERFASGLKAAVDKALEVGPIKPTLLQRGILAALLRR